MGLGQTMLTAAFFVLLTVMFINAYRVLSAADEQLLTAETYKAAGDLARSLMAEIFTKKFDEATTPSSAQPSTSSFTAPSSLGPDPSLRPQEGFALPDVYPNYKSVGAYDDVDDYDNYWRTDSANGMGGFKDSVIVYYLDATQTPPVQSSYVQWYKMIEVWVTQSKYMISSSGQPIWIKLTAFVTNTRKG